MKDEKGHIKEEQAQEALKTYSFPRKIFFMLQFFNIPRYKSANLDVQFQPSDLLQIILHDKPLSITKDDISPFTFSADFD